ncbi:MAG: Sec-independent protein translocase protein TatB [Pseudomonadales bacterium]
MFDIGFAELLLIAVVGLLVIGPEQLPGTIRTISLWLGRLRRSFNEIKSDIEREIGADDIKRQLHNETILKELEDTRAELNAIADDTEEDVNKVLQADHPDDKP